MTIFDINPFSDSYTFTGRDHIIQNIIKLYPKHVHLYGPVCIGKRTLIIYLLKRTSLRTKPFNNIYKTITYGYSPSKSSSVENIFLSPWNRHIIEKYIISSLNINKSTRGLINPTSEFLDKVYEYSSGSPCVVSTIMYNVFRVLNKRSSFISVEHFEKARYGFESELRIKYFDEINRRFSKSERFLIANGFRNNKNPSQLLKPNQIADKFGLKLNVVTKLLSRLLNKGILYRTDRGKYHIFSYSFINILYPKV